MAADAGRKTLTKGFARDMAPIRVNMVSPAVIEIGFYNGSGKSGKL
jgi:NAD(P)-dependent dehydrogenase (short-subunit alcohol dehydrogenase family)